MITPEQRALARSHGYSDQEIDDYLMRKSSGVTFETSQPGTPMREAQIDRTQGAPALPRAAAAFKANPQERLSYFKQHFGDQNVSVTPGGEILWKNPQTTKWTAIDEPGFSPADLAEFAGDLPEMIGAGGGAILGGLPGAALGAAAGNVLKQGIGDLLPGQTARTPLESAGSVATSAALGAAGEGVGRVAAAPIRTVKDAVTRWIANRALKTGSAGFESDFARESMRLSDKHKIDLAASQITQGPFEKTIAGYAARSPFGLPAFERFETGQQRQADASVKAMLDRLGPNLNAEGVGESVAQTLHRRLLDLVERRNTEASRDFGFLDVALGGQSVIPTTNMRNFLLKEAEKFEAPDMPQGREVAAMLREHVNEVPLGLMSARAIEERLKRYGHQTYGKEGPSIFKNMDRELETRLKRGMYSELVKDLKEATEAGGFSGPPAKLLKLARENYEKNAAAVEGIEDSTLGKFMYSPGMQGRGTERVAGWFTQKGRTPSEIRNAAQILNTVNPGVMDEVARHMIARAYEAGREGGKGSLAGFDRAALLKNLPDPDMLKALGKEDLSTAMSEMGELLSRSLWQGGQRPVLQESPFKTAGSLAAQETMFGKAKLFLERILTPKVIANFETDAQARADLFATLKAYESGNPTRAQESALRRVLQRAIPAAVYEGGVSLNPENDPNRGPVQ